MTLLGLTCWPCRKVVSFLISTLASAILSGSRLCCCEESPSTNSRKSSLWSVLKAKKQTTVPPGEGGGCRGLPYKWSSEIWGTNSCWKVVSFSIIRAVFNWMSKVIKQLLWFCIATLCDWLKNLAPLSQPIRSKTKTNRVLPARVFPRLAPATCICDEFWLVDWIVCVSCDWLE